MKGKKTSVKMPKDLHKKATHTVKGKRAPCKSSYYGKN